jgi:RND superfamily putative drug exporter
MDPAPYTSTLNSIDPSPEIKDETVLVHPFVDRYVTFLERAKWLIMIFWLLAVGGCVYPVILLFPATRLFFDPPPGSPTAIANAVLGKYFPQYVNQEVCVVLLEGPKESILSNYTEDLILNRIYGKLSEWGYDDLIVDKVDYWSLHNAGLEAAALGTINITSNRSAMLVSVTSKEMYSSKATRYTNDFMDLLDDLELAEGYVLHRTGSMFLFMDFVAHLLHEIVSTDTITASFALVVIVLFVGSVPLVILPILSLIVSIITSMAVLYGLTQVWPIATFVPGIMLSLILAITIDYSFFLLVRYNREITDFPEEKRRAVLRTVGFAGQVITVSGITLAISFLGIVMLGVGFMNGVAIGCFVALLIMISVNLTLGPSLLLAFPNFFSQRLCWRCKTGDMETSLWYRLAAFAVTTRGAIILLVVTIIITVPVIVGIHWFKIVDDMSMVFIKQLPGTTALNFIQEYFPPGAILPLYLTAESKTEDVFGDGYFNESAAFISQVIADTNGGISSGSVIASSWLGQPVSFPVAWLLNYTGEPDYQYLMTRTIKIKEDGQAATAIMFTAFSPASPSFTAFSDKLRGSFQAFTKTHSYPFNWTLGGLEIQVHDLSVRAWQRFPIMLSITIVVICAFVSASMRSVAVPIRLVISIGWTVAWTFGMCSLIFCSGILDWISHSISGNDGNIYWIVPLLITTIVIGLGCDYDIFLFTRITELRAAGKTPDEAIREGYYHTGEVITGAGLVMAIAFSGLAVSGMPILRQVGIFLAASVLLDTFIVRMLMVPPILHFIGRFNWWPSKLYRDELLYRPITSTF